MRPVLLAHPAARIEGAFRAIHARRMRGLPLVNPVLNVEAAGFRPWESHWLGVLITPWCMNLMLMPREPGRWREAASGDAVAYVFPAGRFEFISGRDETLGAYQACSLFSPMFQFTDQEAARLTALAALQSLFDGSMLDQGCDAGERADAETAMTKRDFLRGGFIPGSHESGR